MKRTAVSFAILTLGAAAFAADSAPAGERRVGGLAGRTDPRDPFARLQGLCCLRLYRIHRGGASSAE